MQQLANHPAADLFPMMSEDELSKLADDIAANGLLEPIIIFHGKVLDGRNRFAACNIADVKPTFIEVSDETVPSPTLYVLSRNLHRRHLTVSQRATVAADSVPMLEEEAEARQKQGKKIYISENTPDETLAPNGAKGKAAQIAAKALNVGTRTVERALEVKRKDPDAYEQVKRGELTVSEASEKIPRIKQHGGHKPKDITTNRGKQRAEAHKRRMIEVLSMANGICEGLANALDISMIRAVCTEEEIETWATKSQSHAREFRKFAARLRGEDGKS